MESKLTVSCEIYIRSFANDKNISSTSFTVYKFWILLLLA